MHRETERGDKEGKVVWGLCSNRTRNYLTPYYLSNCYDYYQDIFTTQKTIVSAIYMEAMPVSLLQRKAMDTYL